MASAGVFAITSVCAALVIATAIVHARAEIARLAHRGSDPFVSRRRALRRVLAAAVLVALMTMLFYGINYGATLHDRRFVHFWNACFALVPVLIGLALLDARETHQVVRKQMRQELSSALRALEQELLEVERKLDERAARDAGGADAERAEP